MSSEIEWSEYPIVEIDREVPAVYVHWRAFDPNTEPRLRQIEMPTEDMGIMLIVDIDVNGKAVGVEIL